MTNLFLSKERTWSLMAVPEKTIRAVVAMMKSLRMNTNYHYETSSTCPTRTVIDGEKFQPRSRRQILEDI
jgi:hypothetical protein